MKAYLQVHYVMYMISTKVKKIFQNGILTKFYMWCNVYAQGRIKMPECVLFKSYFMVGCMQINWVINNITDFNLIQHTYLFRNFIWNSNSCRCTHMCMWVPSYTCLLIWLITNICFNKSLSWSSTHIHITYS